MLQFIILIFLELPSDFKFPFNQAGSRNQTLIFQNISPRGGVKGQSLGQRPQESRVMDPALKCQLSLKCLSFLSA